MHHRLCQVLIAMTIAPAVSRLAVSDYLQTSAAVEIVTVADHTLLQCHGESQNLKSRARFVRILNALIAPHGFSGLGFQGIRFRIVRRCIHLLLILFTYLEIIIQVEVIQGGHAKNGARIDIHGNGTGTVLHFIVGYRLLQVFLKIVLNRCVNGAYGVVPLRRIRTAVKISQYFPVRGCKFLRFSCGTRQSVVIVILNAAQSGSLIPYEPDHMAGELIVWVLSLLNRFQVDAIQVILVNIGSYRFGSIPIDFTGNDFIPGLRILLRPQDLIFVHLQHSCKIRRDLLSVFAVLGHFRRTDKNIVGFGGNRKCFVRAVINTAALCQNLRTADLLVHSKARVFFVIPDLQDRQSCDKNKEKHRCNYAAQ